MPYSWQELQRFAIPAPHHHLELGDLSGGVNRIDELPDSVRTALSTTREGENRSNVDDGIMRDLLRRYTPEDARATFLASARGRNAIERKKDHADDYIDRTVRHAQSVVKAEKGDTVKISVNFSKTSGTGRHVTKHGFIEERADQIEPQKKEWLWRPYIPAGRITIIAGDPGMGKSTIAIDIVSRISRGGVMPGGEERSQSMGSCAIATAEDHTAETIIPRLIAANANLKRVRILRKMQIDGQTRYLSFPQDLERLQGYIVDNGIRIFVLDPLNAFLGASTDTYKDHDVRLALSPLEDIAENTGCAVLIVAHLNKKEDSATLYRVGGSIGFIGAARSVLAVSQNPQDEQMRVLYSLKSNLSRRPPALQYTLGLNKNVDDSYAIWHGQSDFDPERVGKYEGPQRRKECLDFLTQELLEGELPTKIVEEHARAVGIPKRTLDRYKLGLGVTSEKRGEGWVFVPPQKWPKK